MQTVSGRSRRRHVSDPRGADAFGDRSAPATDARSKTSNPQLAIDRASSRNRAALARGQSERELLQAPVSVTAPRYVTVPRGAVSGSREPSRHPQSRVVSAARRRSRLPPPRRRDKSTPTTRRPKPYGVRFPVATRRKLRRSEFAALGHRTQVAELRSGRVAAMLQGNPTEKEFDIFLKLPCRRTPIA